MNDVEAMINAAGWSDGVLWAIGQPDLLATFRESSGIDLAAHRSRMESLVDDATGKRREDLEAFVDWFTEEIWGADMDPRGVSG